MIREERLKRQRAEAAAAEPSPYRYAAPFSRDPRLDAFYQAPPRLASGVTIGGQTYREIDNGRANVLVPVSDLSPAQLEERLRAINRAFFIADHPFGAFGDGIAGLANASPQARNGALIAGGLADVAAVGVAPLVASVRRPTPSPQGQSAPPTLQRPNIRQRELNATGQATGIAASLTAPMLGSGTMADRRLTPPGWQGNGRKYNEARSHLLARDLGGSGSDMRNIVTLTQNGANTPQMRDFEQGVARRVRGGEVVEYSATPLYDSGVLPPSAVLLTAYGSRGAPTARIVQNPAGRRR